MSNNEIHATFTKGSVLSFSPAPAGSRIIMRWTDGTTDEGTLIGWAVVVVWVGPDDSNEHPGSHETTVQPVMVMPSLGDRPITRDDYEDYTSGAIGTFCVEYHIGGSEQR